MEDKMKITFTSYRDSLELTGVKFAIDKRTPTNCVYPVVGYLAIPRLQKQIEVSNYIEETLTYSIIRDNAWKLKGLLEILYNAGVQEVVFADWQVRGDNYQSHSVVIGKIIEEMVEDGEIPESYNIQINYRDGRERSYFPRVQMHPDEQLPIAKTWPRMESGL